MNKFENWFCGSSIWRYVTERRLLPWILSGYALGDHVLEVGAGPGATTKELLRRAGRVTSLEYDHSYVRKLAERHKSSQVTVVQGDAAALPFPDHTFSSVVAVLVLHHLRSLEQQNAAFQEFHRVLRPGGMFFAFEIRDGCSARGISAARSFRCRRLPRLGGLLLRDSRGLRWILSGEDFALRRCVLRKRKHKLVPILLSPRRR